ncbi:MAG TPA: M20/M25/M40 family metallo-hydrolase [Vicinamibacterales bacterium]|nr:M20/M25/M40 family metallo-hydrolase [Vicinamibacterales bacterium]
MISDPVDIVGLTRSLVDIDSTTGGEGPCGRWLADYLRGRGWSVEEQRVDGTRFNVLARHPAPRLAPAVVFSTHFDCVPSFFPSHVEGDRLFGRGACDAKGILAAQVSAAEQLRHDGESRIGLAFVVGEERGSDGARVANAAAAGSGARFLINGEPTDNRLGLATRGILRLKLRASGRAAHSSFPELGDSAIDKLIDALVELRAIALPSDPVLGRTHYTVGLISGGLAPNVVSPSAEAEVMFRTTSEAAEVRRAMAPLERRVAIEHVLEVPPVRLKTVPGFEAAVFPYTTDIPFLSAWGEPLLFGPGSIHVAHTADEWVSITELTAAAGHYVTLAKALLQ